MHITGICWACAVVLLFPGVLADGPENNLSPRSPEKGYVQRAGGERPRIFAQLRLETRLVQTSITSTMYETSTTSTIYHPKITEAPVLRRKLGSNKWDAIHNGIQGQKRDATSCPSDFQLCPQSMKGGCCPNDRVCGTNSCYAAAAAPVSACGKAGYIACGIDDGGGCCPSDYVCGRNGCTPSVGVSATETCGVGSYLCPASVGYGCCLTGMGCGISNCYSTEVLTLTWTETTTTTNAGKAQTLTSTLKTTLTPQQPTGIATTGQSGVVAKVTSSPEASIPKIKASGPSGGGLTTAQLGGIVSGAVLILIAILIAAFFIIKRLNRLKIMVEASRRSSSGPQSRESKRTPDVDELSIDPLMMSPSEVSRGIRHDSHPSQPPSAIHSSHHEVEASTPPYFSSPWSPRSPAFNKYGSGYVPISSSEPSSSGGNRNRSLESTPGLHQSPAGYFDFAPTPDLRDQNLRFGRPPGRRPSKQDRQWSQSSEQSQISLVSQTSSRMAELEGSPSRVQRAFQGIGLSRLLTRRKSSTPTITSPRKTSDPIILTSGPTARPEWAMSPLGLGHIPEAGESRLDIQHKSARMSNAEMIEASLLKREAYARKEQQERDYVLQPESSQGMELLRDVDIGHG